MSDRYDNDRAEEADPSRPERRRRGHLEWWQDEPTDAELADERYDEWWGK